MQDEIGVKVGLKNWEIAISKSACICFGKTL